MLTEQMKALAECIVMHSSGEMIGFKPTNSENGHYLVLSKVQERVVEISLGCLLLTWAVHGVVSKLATSITRWWFLRSASLDLENVSVSSVCWYLYELLLFVQSSCNFVGYGGAKADPQSQLQAQ